MTIAKLLTRVAAALLASTALSAMAQDDVQGLADRWMQAYNRHDKNAIGALYAESGRLMMHGSPTIVGRAKIADFWAMDFEDRDPLTLLKVTHHVAGPDMMLVHGDYDVVNRETGARLSGGRFAHIWTRPRNGMWQLDRDLWSEAFEPYASDSDYEGEVQALADKWVAAYNQHDRRTLEALYSADARLMLHGAPTYVGRANIGAFWAQDFQAMNPLTLLNVTHAVDGVDMVLVHGNYEVVDRDDGTKVGYGRFAHIWTADGNGGWVLDRDLWFGRTQ
jgi:uncharacterized protein (TIGR02246 family)